GDPARTAGRSVCVAPRIASRQPHLRGRRGGGGGRLQRARVEAQQLHQQAWYAGEAAQIDPTAGGRERTRIAGQPVGQRLRAQVVGVQHVDQGTTVVPTADETEHEPAGRQVLQQGSGLRPGEVEARVLVQISRVARLRRHALGETVFAHGVEHGRIAVYPDRVVIIPDCVHVGAVGPVAPYSLLIV